MDNYEHHSVTSEKVDGGSVVTESHHKDGLSSHTKRFVPGKTPSKDLRALIAEGPRESGTDGAGSRGMRGAKSYLDGHV